MSSDSITEILNELLRRTSLIETGIQNLGARLETVESDLSSLQSTVGTLQTNVESLHATVETRLQDTRPIGEAIQAQNKHHSEQLESLHSEVERGFRTLDRGFDKIAGELTRLRAAHDDLEDRFDKLEKEPA